jgi:hypothetical protein
MRLNAFFLTQNLFSRYLYSDAWKPIFDAKILFTDGVLGLIRRKNQASACSSTPKNL